MREVRKGLAITADLSSEDRNFRAGLSDERKMRVASDLGVSVAALDCIGIGRAETKDLKRLRASGRGWKDAYPPIVSSFPERDATGAIGAIVGICFRVDDGRKGSPSGEVGAKRGLIIPSTLSTRPDPVLLVEGPTDVAACETLGLASVGRPSNASGGRFIAQLLARRKVLIVGENDQNPAGTWPGREGAEKLATYLATKWKRVVRWALPPEGHKDVRAYLQHLVAKGLDLNDEQACHEAGKRFVESLIAVATEEQPPASSSKGHIGDDGAREAVLHLCVEAGDHFFHDNENRAFALVREGGVARTLPVRSRDYGLLLGRRFYRATGSGLPTTAKTEAIATLEGLAIFDGPEELVFVRIGEYEGKVVLDLCDERWRVVVIGKDGWEVVNESPIRFRRTRGMLALPAPVPGGLINDLRPFINVRTDNDFVVVCAFILGCLNPCGPFMILLVNGEPGSAKSTLCRLIRALIDPNKAPLRSEPKDNRDLAIAANNAWMIGLDNMSRVSERMSNALCRLATGGGFATRELYTDADEMIFDGKRPVMINGIGDIADRSDLIDRAVRLTLPTIPEHQRRTERAIWSAFEGQRPAILGAFLDAVSVALRNQDAVRFTRLPRMADSASWVVAAETACPWAPGSFIAALDDQRRDADEFVIEASPLANAVKERVEQHGEIEGTASEILGLLSADQDEKILKHPDWPKRAPAFGTKLREVAPNLRRLGIEVQFDRNAGRRTITIRKNEGSPDLPSSLSLPSPGVQEAALAADGGGSVGPNHDSELPCRDGETASDDSVVSAQEGSKSEQMTAMTAMTAVPPESQRDGQGPGFEVDAAEDEGVL
ncbi:MAG: toprim domain-containing protein [Planctomycetes bacterium]|nr:toprim domain-containing protein [Planctomycetota bacterium]